MADATKQDIRDALYASGIYNRKDWYKFLLIKDYGNTIFVRTADMEQIRLIECFYDTDENGDITTFHGVISIDPKNLAIAISRMLAYAATIRELKNG